MYRILYIYLLNYYGTKRYDPRFSCLEVRTNGGAIQNIGVRFIFYFMLLVLIIAFLRTLFYPRCHVQRFCEAYSLQMEVLIVVSFQTTNNFTNNLVIVQILCANSNLIRAVTFSNSRCGLRGIRCCGKDVKDVIVKLVHGCTNGGFRGTNLRGPPVTSGPLEFIAYED